MTIKEIKKNAKKMLGFFKIGDFIIILILTVVSVFLFIAFFSNNSVNSFANIYLDNNLIYSVKLSENINETKMIKTEHGEITVEILNGKIRVKSSPCRDKICINTGFISKKGQTVICLPEKLIIIIESNKGEVDIVA